MNSGYTPKNLVFNEEAREKLINGIQTMSDAVKSTLGPSGQTVLIESPHHTHGLTVTKDGVTVAKSIDLIDPVENLAVRMMKEAADRTATSAGDGTTTSIVLTESLATSGFRLITKDKTKVLRELVSKTEEIIEELKSMSREVTADKLVDIATISANNDPAIGKIIASVYNEVGENGIVTVEKSHTSETYFETTTGLKIDRGYSSHLFINDFKKDECILENVKVLVADTEINNILSIENVLKPVIASDDRLLIIAECSSNVINTLAANVMKRGLKVCVIQPPSFGYKQHELMQDIALSVGAKYFSQSTGDDLSLITPDDLGFAKKVVIDKSSTIVVKDESHSAEVDERVSQLKEAANESKKKADKDFILSRVATLTGGIGVIYVGGNTDLEQKELYDRVDDAVCATRSALEEGILPGGGYALHEIAKRFDESYNVADRMLKIALESPMRQILINAGLEYSKVYSENENPSGSGYDVKNHKYGDMYEMGIIDPTKVTKNALQNAVSVAVTILSTNAIITMARSYENE
jgi:chaperonin GroEL